MGEMNSESITWTTFPSGPGLFATIRGDQVQPNQLRQSMYQNQAPFPIKINPSQMPPQLRGVTGIG